MKKIITNIFSAGLAIVLLPACLKDKGNYQYDYGNAVTIRFSTYSYAAFLKDTIKVYPMRTFSNPADTTEFDHSWVIDGKEISNEPVLKYAGEKLGEFGAYYYMIDKKTGIRFPAAGYVNLKVTSPYAAGWGILYEKNNESELAHVRIAGNTYFDYTEIYRKQNDGEVMGSGPIKMREYNLNNPNFKGMFLSQSGGQGPIELDASTLQRKLIVKNIFTGAVPQPLAPIGMAFYPVTDFMVNGDGAVYARVKPQEALPFALPWVSTPVYISGGLKVDDVWECWSNMSGWGIMHEQLGNRLLFARLWVPNPNNPAIALDTFPTPAVSYPVDYPSLSRMGNMQYIWGGSFNDFYGSMDGALIIKDPADNKYYWVTFGFNDGGYKPSITPKSRILFNGGSVLTSSSLFTAVKPRDYLFFTGGASNNELWYYDAKTHAPVKKYATLPAKITKIIAHDDGNSLAVGLENGIFILYDITTQVIADGVSKELHSLEGLGKVVDIIQKGGIIN